MGTEQHPKTPPSSLITLYFQKKRSCIEYGFEGAIYTDAADTIVENEDSSSSSSELNQQPRVSQCQAEESTKPSVAINLGCQLDYICNQLKDMGLGESGRLSPPPLLFLTVTATFQLITTARSLQLLSASRSWCYSLVLTIPSLSPINLGLKPEKGFLEKKRETENDNMFSAELCSSTKDRV
ncbi:hypothetical protein STEG23_002330 [Scotinomys teguina]